MKFRVDRKTGFISEDKVITIFDEYGNIFYYKKNLADAIFFNLPEGVYSSDNLLYQAPAPRYYKPKTLPPQDTFITQPAQMDFEYCYNPNKCSVDLEAGKIFMDHSFKKAPQVVQDFIIGHEMQHYKFSNKGNESEVACDMGSYNMLVEVGYNPAQIAWAQDHSLSKNYKSNKRREAMDSHLKNTY